MNEGVVKCLDCGMQERESHAPNHICNTITDFNYPSEWLVGSVIKVGKRKYVKLI